MTISPTVRIARELRNVLGDEFFLWLITRQGAQPEIPPVAIMLMNHEEVITEAMLETDGIMVDGCDCCDNPSGITFRHNFAATTKPFGKITGYRLVGKSGASATKTRDFPIYIDNIVDEHSFSWVYHL